ncbi:ABC transporter substrate-binding protein [Salipaludibacillus sp. HK11]|uniref:ABC transporter substrate-binding protein n=1 Tax=Salipaludibacillus sp. HK11 TaxID=3394320 RepID=UPI0039FBCB51
MEGNLIAKKIFGIIPITLLILTGCSESTVKSSENTEITKSLTQEASDYAAVIHDFADREISFTDAPSNIAALSNGDMDIIHALGGNLVGRPTTNSPLYIDELQTVEEIGTVHEIDLEKITYVKPDVVLGNDPMSTKDIPIIEGIGAEMVLTSANSIDEIKRQIELYGQLLEKDDLANEIISDIDDKITSFSGDSSSDSPRVLVVYGAPGTYMAALPNSLSGDILEHAGGINIASDFPSLENYPQYAQLNGERIVEANPDLILLMTHGNSESVREGFIREMKENGAWNNLDAVIKNHVEVLPSDLFGANPGTRIIEALDLLDDLLEPVR